jgi:uncharacterized protein (DUF2344 family)
MIYTQENISNNKFKRVFSSDVPERELVWHMDKENRIVEVLEDSEWLFQMDNELPISLKKGVKLEIPKETFHRVIKGSGGLKILIEEY